MDIGQVHFFVCVFMDQDDGVEIHKLRLAVSRCLGKASVLLPKAEIECIAMNMQF